MNEGKPLALRRICAYLVDYVLILIFMGVLIGFNLFILGLEFSPSESLHSKLKGHAIGFSTLTLPVWLYFTVMESTRRGATLGKRVMLLAVQQSNDGHQLPLTRSALRSAVKFAPWEAAHIAIWYVPGRPFIDPMPILNLIVLILALVIALFFLVSLFLFRGRTPYDKLSRSMTVKI